MKKTIFFLFSMLAVVFTSQAQFLPGNPQWKWDTVILFNAQNDPAFRYLQNCDVNGNILEQQTQVRESNEWVNKTKTTLEYEAGHIKTAVTAMWNSGQWYNIQRITPEYDAYERIVSELLEQNKIGGWSNYRFRHYSYGDQNRKEEMLQERWDAGAWVNDTKNTYLYNEDGSLASITYQFSETGEGWINGMRLLYTCDPAGNWLEAMLESWETGTWTGGYKIIYANDTRGNILSETYATLTGNAWVNEFRQVYTYDENDNVISSKNETFAGITWTPSENSGYIYFKKDILLMISDEYYRAEVSYRYVPLGIYNIIPERLSLYPNPACDNFRISCGDNLPLQFIIFDESGVAVMQSVAAPYETVDVSGLRNGAYFIRATGGRNLYSGKLLITH